jgi:hypothetical protein
MGRKKEHVASKSFTIGLKELAFLSEEADRLDIKQSKLLTKYIRLVMLDSIEKAKIEHGPITWCTKCGDHREFTRKDGVGFKNRWVCKACGDDKTAQIVHMFPTHQV